MEVSVYLEQWVCPSATATLQVQRVGKTDIEGAHGGGIPDVGKETADVGDDQGDGEKHRRLGCGGGGWRGSTVLTYQLLLRVSGLFAEGGGVARGVRHEKGRRTILQ